MKKYLLIPLLVFSFCAGFTQTKPKQKEKEKPPTQKELQEMMKEMQGAMDEMSAEDKKAMDSLGIKMPDMKAMQKNVAGISDAQLKTAYENENRIVPQKDPARITKALSVSLSNVDMNAFISKANQSVLQLLSAETKAKGNEILQQVNKLNGSVAKTAVGLWMDGKPTLALYLMGEACTTDPSNAINLNNYAAFLTMCGAQQLALPILNNLNKRYPKQSSILNNIAQAWLGLGDIERAEKYADSCIRIYAAHPQANMAKCLIEESKGNIPAAIAAAKKSINKAYSNEKENKLKKLGYNLKSEDLNWDRPKQDNLLGLANFKWPEYPMNVEASKLSEMEWKKFKQDCQEKINELSIKLKSLEEEMIVANNNRTKLIISESQKGHYVQLMPGYAAKAIKKLGPAINDVDGNSSFVFVQALEPIVKAQTTIADYEATLNEKQEILNKKYEDKFGEGKENPAAAVCKDENAIRSEFLSKANGDLQSLYRNYLNYVSRRTSDLLYYYQYTMWPEQFEVAKVSAQIGWLTQIKDQGVYFKPESGMCKSIPKPKKFGELQKFDDVACQYVSKMDLGVYKITSSCSDLKGEFDFGGVKINVQDNVETGRFSGSAIVGVSKGFDGPMSMETEATLGGLVEWDNTGITDVGAVAGVSASAAGVNIAGADAKITVNSGVSTNGSTILQGIK